MKLPERKVIYASGELTVKCPKCEENIQTSTDEMFMFTERDYGGEYPAIEIVCPNCKADLRLRG